MIRYDLKNIPTFDLPKDYTIKWHQPGDEILWLNIHKKADKYNRITQSLFDKAFGPSPKSLFERQCFLMDKANNAIGTATAWFNDNYNGTRYGRIHWVAIIPEKQGQGLAKPLVSIICNRLQRLNHHRVYLTTLSLRIQAINLYCKFGFRPEIRCSEDVRIWQKIETKLKESPSFPNAKLKNLESKLLPG